jgi:hypothetical protein
MPLLLYTYSLANRNLNIRSIPGREKKKKNEKAVSLLQKANKKLDSANGSYLKIRS